MSHKHKEATPGLFDEEVLYRFCHECNAGIYRQHHEFPHKYIKCPVCGHTKEIFKSKETLNSDKPDEGKD